VPRFYLHQRTWASKIEDPEGSDLPDLDAARDEAVKAARQLLAAAVLKGAAPQGIGFEISDELGRNLLYVAFRTVLPPSICDLPADGGW
jgi:hypothetical protein